MAKPKKRRKIIVFTLLGLVLVALTIAALTRKHEPVITVQTEKVSRRNLTELVTASGKIQPVTQVVISPEVAGEIVSLPVKEGDRVKKGELLVQIKPDNYIASRNSAEAHFKSASGSKELARAQLEKAEAEFKRHQNLFDNGLVSDSVFLDYKTAYSIAKLQYQNAAHSEDQARFGLDKAMDDLSKTTIVAPIDGTIARLNSQAGERVLGTSFNKGTEIMTIADLTEMEARVDIGEAEVVLIAPGQVARLEVDAFRDRKFSGHVTEIANSAKGLGQGGMGGGGGGGGQEATRFEVRIRIKEKELFRPGMTITAEIETRYRTNALTVPIASVTTRVPKEPKGNAAKTNSVSTATNAQAATTNDSANIEHTEKKKEASKLVEAVFVVENGRARLVPVKIGISNDDYWEITDGLEEGQEVVSGGYRAISRDLEDGKKIMKGAASDKEEPAK